MKSLPLTGIGRHIWNGSPVKPSGHEHIGI